MIFLRSLLFNILFYSGTLLACILLLPGLFFSREVGLNIARLWISYAHLLEKYIIGLDYEIRGQEHLPKDGSYIVAAKHQSAYETMKLHKLFNDPSIVLKKELLDIPLWGHFLKKVDVIAIDRSSREQAMDSIVDGAKRIKKQGRPIVIFPQGTRVAPETTSKEKPYKGGIVKMALEADLPVIPMALNSGLFWRRNQFLKYPGKVIFEFLPPVDTKLDKNALLKSIEDNLEARSNQLMDDAKRQYPYLPFQRERADGA